MPTQIALVSARAAHGQDEDAPALIQALRALQIDAVEVDWDDESVDWSRYRLALLRSTWDYSTRLPQFLAWAERAAAATQLCNPLPVIRWNTDKHYLADLQAAGVPVVASHFIEPGTTPAAGLQHFLAAQTEPELVVKPAVSAGSRDTQRYARTDIAAIQAHAEALLRQQRSVLLQPYLTRIDESGETALLYFDGRFSHAIRKAPLLRRGRPPARALHAPETIQPREPTSDELALAQRTLASLPDGLPLYARVDIIRAADGSPRILELELTEPSLFLKQGAGAAQRCAAAVAARL